MHHNGRSFQLAEYKKTLVVNSISLHSFILHFIIFFYFTDKNLKTQLALNWECRYRETAISPSLVIDFPDQFGYLNTWVSYIGLNRDCLCGQFLNILYQRLTQFSVIQTIQFTRFSTGSTKKTNCIVYTLQLAALNRTTHLRTEQKQQKPKTTTGGCVQSKIFPDWNGFAPNIDQSKCE